MPIVPGDEQSTIKPTTKDPHPTARAVNDFHYNDDADSNINAHHHTLGIGRNKASAGTHDHTAKDSRKIGSSASLTLTGELTWEDVADANLAFNNLVTMLKSVIQFTDNRSG